MYQFCPYITKFVKIRGQTLNFLEEEVSTDFRRFVLAASDKAATAPIGWASSLQKEKLIGQLFLSTMFKKLISRCINQILKVYILPYKRIEIFSL
jgi:hypothetical protein